MPATYEPIATTTLGSAAATISFTSIGSGYTDLRLVVVGKLTSGLGSGYYGIRFNSDTTNSYSLTVVAGNGSVASSNRLTSQPTGYLQYNSGLSTTEWTTATMDLFNYAGSTNKTFLSTWSGDLNGSGFVERQVNLWRNTTAITSITLHTDSAATYTAGTTATLYGILKA